jgi:tRNA modification GTPase
VIPKPHTIAAPATASGRAALAVVRISGSAVTDIVRSRTGRSLEPRRATFLRWCAKDGSLLDEVVATFWQGPASYTGEDILELSLHGNPLIVRAVLEDLALDGIRLAAPGEFTRRAVENGKLGLSRAEAVAAVVDAETRSALQAARHQLSGGLEPVARVLRERLIEASAWLELETDFAEEEAVPDASHILPALESARTTLVELLRDQERLARQNLSPRVVLAGHPNAGKSSLSNALLGQDRLLVSPIRGTTRDWVEVPLIFPEGQITLVDTAGLGAPTDELDAAAQERTRQELSKCQMILLLVESGRDLASDEQAWLNTPGREVLLVRTKTDLAAAPDGELGVSVLSGDGLDALSARLRSLLVGQDGFDPTQVALGSARQRECAQRALGDLEQSIVHARSGQVELSAFLIRHVLALLSELVGETTPDDLLETIFSRFCIGK